MLFGIGITWGLPSRAIDPFLFGDREPWSGETINRLAGTRPETTTRGADVDATPMLSPDDSAIANETDEQRAQILIRYRLYTFQPDEMITFMSLSEMNPSSWELDPKLYQYGGCWIYSVGIHAPPDSTRSCPDTLSGPPGGLWPVLRDCPDLFRSLGARRSLRGLLACTAPV
jgi:hypothetical protein